MFQKGSSLPCHPMIKASSPNEDFRKFFNLISHSQHQRLRPVTFSGGGDINRLSRSEAWTCQCDEKEQPLEAVGAEQGEAREASSMQNLRRHLLSVIQVPS